jgi:hypothetical protein
MKSTHCKILNIRKKYCTINLKGYNLNNIEISKNDKGVCIENLDLTLPCFKK